MAWNTAHLSREDKFCDLEDCIDSCEAGCVLICGHAYHYECFLFKLESQCQYCNDYIINGIETNCKAFQKTLNSSGMKAKEESIDEIDDTPDDDTNINDADFLLDINIDHDNIDLLFERVINALTSM